MQQPPPLGYSIFTTTIGFPDSLATPKPTSHFQPFPEDAYLLQFAQSPEPSTTQLLSQKPDNP